MPAPKDKIPKREPIYNKFPSRIFYGLSLQEIEQKYGQKAASAIYGLALRGVDVDQLTCMPPETARISDGRT